MGKNSAGKDATRKLFLEQLEDRRLLAVGPQIIGIQPNDGELLLFDEPDQIRNTAPRELLFRFDENQVFDTGNLDGIQITRSNLDGEFAAASVESDFNTGESTIRFTARKLGVEQNGITLVVAKRDQGGAGAPEIGVVGNRIDVSLNVTPDNETTAQQLVTAINNDIDAKALVLAELVPDGTGTTFPDTDIASPPINYSPLQLSGANDVVVDPGFIGLGDSPNEILVRFAETLPDDLYQIDIYGEGQLALRNDANVAFQDLTDDGVDDGSTRSLQFDLDLGAQITSVVPQPVKRLADGTLEQARDQVLVYFNDDDLDPVSAEDPSFYQLIYTNETVHNLDDVSFNPDSVSYNPGLDAALLTFAAPLDQLTGGGGTPVGPGSFRLRIGTDESAPLPPLPINLAADPGSSFDTAHSLAASGLETQSLVISQEIQPDYNYDLEFPSSSDEPGHREHNVAGELHLNSGSDDNSGIETILYNFREHIGFIDGDGGTQQSAFNVITEIQKARAREIFEIFSGVSGVQFVETTDQGIIVATGDLAAMGGVSTPGGVIGLSGATAFGPAVIMDNAETWHDEVGRHRSDGLSWFLVAMHEIGHQMGLGHAYDLPTGTVMGNGGHEAVIEDTEPVFPGDHDIVHLQNLHRPEGRDIDLYEFEVSEAGLFTAETIAERRLSQTQQQDLLDTHLALYQVRVELDPVTGVPLRDGGGDLIPILDSNGTEIRDLVARNDDYFSNDSFIELELREGKYFVAVTASGNWRFDPAIENTGFYGKTQGSYDLRLNFRASADRAIVDLDNPVDAQRPEIIPTRIDADGDGVPGGVYNHWFRVAAPSTATPGEIARTVFVDKLAPAGGDGTPQSPFNNLKSALNVDDNGIQVSPPDPHAVRPGDVLRIVGNPGADNDIRTELDNRGYELGFNDLGTTLSDGTRFQVPRDVTVMVDAGALFKMRRSWVGIGSVAPGSELDRSGGAFQVVGAPIFVDALGNTLPLDGNFPAASPLENLDGDGNESAVVHFTSYNDESLGLDTDSSTTTPEAGNWGGLIFRRDVDNADQTRFSYEGQGIFLDSVNHADIRYGGGEVNVESVSQTVDPIEIRDGRPTISHNEISFSRDAAIAASPDSFLETNFHSPQYQANLFTSDYSRIGPDILRNQLHDNTINGLFVRIATPAGGELEQLTVSGRWDDKDIVHVLKENLVIHASPGGPFLETVQPSLAIVTLTPLNHPEGQLAAGSYNYRLVFVDKYGNEGAPSDATVTRQVTAGNDAIRLNQLLAADGEFVARRLYRSADGGGGPYTLIAQINQDDTEFIDLGTEIGGTLDETPFRMRPRPDARLRVDPSMIVKLDASRIDMEPGAQMIAEGRDGHEIIFTSILDDRYGVGGTYDTTGDGANAPGPGDWGGIHTTITSRLSIDHSIFAYGGGITRIEGTFAGFNVIEIHQSEARIAHSIFEFNGGGVGGQAPDHRFGRGFNRPALMFVRGAQPIIVDNIFRDNTDSDDTSALAAIDINVNSLNHELKHDYGRSTGAADALPGYRQNHGPLVVANRLGNNEINGMVIRGETLTTQSIWDDADIVHVVLDQITVPDLHTYGGLRLASNPTQSLVVKLQGSNAGFVAEGRPLETDDRVGGVIQIVGQPKSPVVLTSLRNDDYGAGVDQNGDPQVDTNNDGEATGTVTQSNITMNYDGATVPADAEIEINKAVAFWQSTLKDPVTIGLDVRFAALGGNTIGTAQPQTYSANFNEVRQRMIDDAGAHEQIVTQLPTRNQLDVSTAAAANTISMTRANALALGYAETDFPTQPTSAFGPGPLHGDLTFRNGLELNPDQLYLVALHEIGHALGFISAVGQGTPSLTTLDLFRLAPGEGFNDFTNAQRVMTTGVEQVFYDGGIYDPTGINIAGLTVGDIPLSNGQDFGPSHWKDDDLIGGTNLGIMDPSYEPDAQVSSNDKRAMDLMGWDLSSGGPPGEGDWSTVLLDQYSHDRNVEIVVESEAYNADSPGVNATAQDAHFLGSLAPNEKSGDENLRLGFEVQGFLSNSSDRDVYSFDAEAGTEVWVDFDRTTYAMDPIVELLDANDLVLAASYNSLTEEAGTSSLFEHSSTPGTAFLAQKTPPFEGTDFWAINPRDAGYRLVLPGPVGTRSTYHLRVRSNTAPGDIHDVSAGLTSGAYQVQVRLREVDELPGSTIRYADISYASTGISVYGLPLHSPLAGENAENEGQLNDTFAQAQELGNLMAVDRSAISVAGNLRTEFRACLTGNPILCPDVDWYTFDVAIQAIQDTDAFAGWPVTFDLDYADGLGRPNTELSVFNEAGSLVFYSRDSNIAEDQPDPTVSDQTEDLTRGTIGTGDPYIGPVTLPAGRYFVAVSGAGGTPAQLTSNLALRLGPPDTVVEDSMDATGSLFDTESIIPWHLGDMGIFVAREKRTTFRGNDPTVPQASEIRVVDAFTGHEEIDVHSLDDQGNSVAGSAGSFFNFDIGDVAMRSDGVLFGYSSNEDVNHNPCNERDVDAGHFIQILDHETGRMDGSVADIGASGITTFQSNAAGDGVERSHPCDGNDVGWGFNVNAMTFGGVEDNDLGIERLLVVGERGDKDRNTRGVDIKRNIVYEMDINTGGVLNINSEAQDQGPWTNAFSIGQIATGAQLTGVDATSETLDAGGLRIQTNLDINDGETLGIDDGFSVTTFEFDFGPQVLQQINQNTGNTVRDGDFFVLDNNAADPSITNENVFLFDTGLVIDIVDLGAGAQTVPDGSIVTIQDTATPSQTISFEFDKDDPAALTDPTAVRVGQYGNATSALGLADLLADAINAQGSLGVVADAVGTRITLVGEFTASLNGVAGSSIVIEGDRGANPIVQLGDGTQVTDGDTLTINPVGGTATVFELDSNGAFANNQVAFTATDTAEQIATSLLGAIVASGSGLTAKQGGTLVSINGLGLDDPGAMILMSANPDGLVNRPATRLIQAEENFDADQIGLQVEIDVTAANVGVTTSSAFDRISFLGAETGDFRGVGAPTWLDLQTAGGVGTPGNIAIGLLAGDLADEIAVKIADAINLTYQGTNSVSATSSGSTVDVINGELIVEAGSNLLAQGSGPGGDITGITTLPGQFFGVDFGQLFAVSDLGGLYTVEVDLEGDELGVDYPSLTSSFVTTSRADLNGIRFQGLTRGPDDIEGGIYRNLLFGMDVDGRIYAFDDEGVLQPIFNGGATSVDTGIDSPSGADIRGLAFTHLTRTLFHYTTQNHQEGADLRDELYGLPNCITTGPRANQPTLKGEPICVQERFGDGDHGHITSGTSNFPGPISMHFGEGLIVSANGATQLPRTYDYAGGAHGTTVSNEFSLRDYSSADRPILYFDYWLDAGGNDPARVFISDNDGDWQLLAGLANTGGVWQQQRIGLEAYAGIEHLRLRFDMSTGGGMNLGAIFDTGSELRTNEGQFLRDGDFFQLDRGGFAIQIPAAGGADILDGEQLVFNDLTATNPNTFTLEFNKTGGTSGGTEPVAISDTDTAAEVATAVVNAIVDAHSLTATKLKLKAYRRGGDVVQVTATDNTTLQIQDAAGPTPSNIVELDDTQYFEFESGFTFVVPSGSAIPSGGTFTVEDGVGVTGIFEFTRDGTTSGTNLPVLISDQDAPADVAQLMQTTIENNLAITGHQHGERLQLEIGSDGSGAVNVSHTLPSPQHDGFLVGEVGSSLGRNFLVQMPALGVLIPDGETLEFTHPDPDGTPTSGDEPTTFTLEFRRAGAPSAGNVLVTITDTMTQSALADAVEAAITNDTSLAKTTLGLDDIEVLAGGQIQIDATIYGTLATASAGSGITLTSSGPSGPGAVTQAYVHEDMSREDVADELNRLLEPNYYSPTIIAVTGMELDDGETFSLSDGVNPVVTFEFDSGFVIELPANGATEIVDGETLSFSDGTDTLTLEFDKGTGVTGGNVAVDIVDGDPLILVANKIVNAINNDNSAAKLALGLDANVLSGGNVQVYAINGTTLTISAGSLIAEVDDDGNTVPDNNPNVDPANIVVRFLPSTFFAASDTATAIEDAINIGVDAHPGLDGIEGNLDDLVLQVTAAIPGSHNQRRVQLTHVPGPNSDIVFDPITSPLALELNQGADVIGNDMVKQHHDLLRIIGWTVTDAGPLGIADSLPGDSAVFNTPQRLQDNRHEGFYFDDISIGFIERGQLAVAGANNDSIVNRGSVTEDGEYQLEIRRADFAAGYDTNDRLGRHYTMSAQDGSDVHDGQTFDISDGVSSVRFEYEDTVAGDGVESGNVQVQFDSTMADWEVARAIRDAVNTAPVGAQLPVTAALSDGANGALVLDKDPEAGRPDIRTGNSGEATTSNLVNLFGPVYVLNETNLLLPTNPTPPVVIAEPNETTLEATATGITGFNSATFLGRGQIGDNSAFPIDPGLDVDLLRVELTQGETLTIDVDAADKGSPLDAYLRVFSATGAELAANNDDGASTDPRLDFTAPLAGTSTYFIGVSGNPASSYDPVIGNNTVVGDIGFYEIELSFGNPPDTEFVFFDNRGDQNHFRDQGQLLIHSNRISHSLGFGIEVDSGNRVATDGNAAHPGPSRHLEEINQDSLLPGVVIANNLVTRNMQGGIRFSGQSPVGPPAPVAFGRIYNNTVVGRGGDLLPEGVTDIGIRIDTFASPTLLNNIVANASVAVQVDSSSTSTVVGGMIYQGNLVDLVGTAEDFGIALQNSDPLFVQPAGDDPNYYLAPGSPQQPNGAIDSSIASLEERFRFNLIKDPLGIPPSPILAPDRDVTGQLRVDDPNTEPAGGLGGNVFIDRGAIDRSDFSGPVAEIVVPRDNDADGNDLNLGSTVVQLNGNAVLSSFEVRLNDGIEPADPNEGIGIADQTVSSEKVILTSNGVLLNDNIDYSYSYNSTNDTIQLTPLAGIWLQDRVYTISLINTDQWTIVAPDGSTIPDGASFHVEDLTGSTTTHGNHTDFEFERGYTISVPQTLEIQVPAEGGGLGGITDGEIFTVREGTSPPKTFEFDRDGTFGQNRFIIDFTVTSTADQIASDIKDALVAVDIGLSPVVLADGRVHLGSKLEHTLDTSLSSLIQSGQADGVADGGIFTIDDSNKLVTFEFEDDDIGDGVTTVGNVAINFTQGNTYEEIADKLVTSITAENLGLAPRNLGEGLVYVGGTVNHVLETTSSKIDHFGQPGVRPALSLRIPTVAGQQTGLQDAETFTIQLGASPPVTFELNNTDVDPGFTLGNVRIDFTDSSSVSEIAGNIVVAIQGAGLNLDPVHVPNTAIVELGGTANHTIDTTNTSLIQLGTPGIDSAVSVDILPVAEFDDTQVAVKILQAINADDVITGVLASPNGGAEVVITGVKPLNGLVDNNLVFLPDAFGVSTPRFIEEIEDLATNPLKSNQLSGETKFTVVLGAIDTDLGDAADGVGQPPQASYPVLTSHDGAIHMVSVDPLHLGERLDRDKEGQSLGFQVTGPGTVMADGEQFIITAGNRVEIFEFERTDVGNGVTTGTVEISVAPADSAEDIAQAIRNAIVSQNLGVIPQDIGNATLLLESNFELDLFGSPTNLSVANVLTQGDDSDGDNYVVDTTSAGVTTTAGDVTSTPVALSVAQTFQLALPAAGAAGLTDGESFTVTQGATSVTFELDSDASVTPGNTAITFAASDTLDAIADTIVSALDGAGLGLAPVNLGGGVVHLGSSAGHAIDASLAPSLSISGQAANVADGETFSITSGTLQAVFEFEESNVIDGVSFGNFPISFSAADTHEQIAASMIGAMDTAVIDARIALNLNPIDRGNGIVELDGDDEDGVTGPAGGPIGFFNAFVTTELEVTASAFGLLDAWIDFNRDGDWDDDHEQVFANQQLQQGVNTLFVSTPLAPVSKAGDTYARFRFSSTGGLTATGLVADGEVEDYLIQIVDGSPPQATDDPTAATTSLYTVTEDDLLNGPSVLDNDSDADGDPFRVLEFDNPSLLGADVDVNLDFNNVAGAGIFTYDPRNAAQLQALAVGEVAGDTFTYGLIESSAHDFQSQTPGTVTITVTGLNDIPTAADVGIAAIEDGVTVSGSFVGDDDDNDNDGTNLVYAIINNLPAGSGTVTNNGDGTFTFDPNAGVDFQQLAKDETLDVTFTYTATDLHLAESTEGTVTVTVTGVNDSPVAVNDAYLVDQDDVLDADDEDGTLTPSNDNDNGVLANDSDPDNGDIPVVIELNSSAANMNTNVTTSLGATINMQADGTFIYDPTTSATLLALQQDVTAVDMFTYTIEDGEGVTASATVTITVNGVNNDPVANDDDFYEVDQDKVLTVPGPENLAVLLDNDTDVDTNDTLSVIPINGGTTTEGGSVTVAADGSFVYDPTGSASLQGLARDVDLDDTFTYTVTDDLGATDTALVTITVHGVNKNPVANPDAYGTDEDTTIFIDTASGLIDGAGADTDPESDTLTVTGINGTSSRSGLSANGAQVDVTASGGLTYNPNQDPDQVINQAIQALNDGDTLDDTFTYTISDGNGGSATGTVTISLTGINDAPRAADDSGTTPRNTSVILPVTDNDTDIDGSIDDSTLVVTENPSAGTATANSDGTITFTPPTDTSGTFTFKYTVRDTLTLAISNEATVTVLVNDRPVANDDSVTAILDVQNTASEFNVLANDTDTEGGLDASTVTIVSGPDSNLGEIEEIKADGTIVYRPKTTVSTPQVDSFTYTVSDTDGAVSDPATVTVNIIDDPAPWQNRLNPLDVNGDGFVSPIDALLIITYLNDNGPGPLPAPTTSFLPPPFLDPTGDDECNATDVIQIINHLNDNASGEGEGESADSDWQRNATSQLDVGVALPVLGDRFAGFSEPLTATASDSQQQAESVVTESSETVTDNSQYRSATVASSNLRATGLKIADSESLEDLLETIADDLVDVGETSVHDLAIEQWTSRYLDN